MNKPYYQEDGITIYHGDCLEILPELPKVDLTITSPPYNLADKQHTGNKKTNAYKDNLPEEQYQELQINILNLIYEHTNIAGSLIYNHKNRIKDHISLTPYIWLLKTKWIMKQELIWFNGSPNFDPSRFYPMTERLYWMNKSKYCFFENKIKHHDLFDWQPVGSSQKHSRQFPIVMVKNMLVCFPEHFIVLDPFLGSGTTAVACKQLGRKCIGIEIEEKYCEIAVKRLAQKEMF